MYPYGRGVEAGEITERGYRFSPIVELFLLLVRFVNEKCSCFSKGDQPEVNIVGSQKAGINLIIYPLKLFFNVCDVICSKNK